MQDASALNALLSTAPLSKSAQKRVQKLPDTERLDGIIQELRYAREARNKELDSKKSKLLERDKSLDKKQQKNLELEQERLDKKEELSLVICQEKTAEIDSGLDALHNTPELSTILGHHHFEQHWNELKAMLNQLQQHPKHEEFQMGDGDEITQREAQYKQLEEEYDQLIQACDDVVARWKKELEEIIENF